MATEREGADEPFEPAPLDEACVASAYPYSRKIHKWYQWTTIFFFIYCMAMIGIYMSMDVKLPRFFSTMVSVGLFMAFYFLVVVAVVGWKTVSPSYRISVFVALIFWLVAVILWFVTDLDKPISKGTGVTSIVMLALTLIATFALHARVSAVDVKATEDANALAREEYAVSNKQREFNEVSRRRAGVVGTAVSSGARYIKDSAAHEVDQLKKKRKEKGEASSQSAKDSVDEEE
jgi:hypothetical protein